MVSILVLIIAVLFLISFFCFKAYRLRWIFLLYAGLSVIVLISIRSHFLLSHALITLLCYGLLCLWITGLILPWFLRQKFAAFCWSAADLILWPAAILSQMESGMSVMTVLLYVILAAAMAANLILVIFLFRKSNQNPETR